MCYRIINTLSTLLFPYQKGNIEKKKRFLDEFTGGELSISQKSSRPDDFSKTFSGNIDDNFKMGIAFTKKSMKVSFLNQERNNEDSLDFLLTLIFF